MDAKLLPVKTHNNAKYRHNGVSIPGVSISAAKDQAINCECDSINCKSYGWAQQFRAAECRGST